MKKIRKKQLIIFFTLSVVLSIGLIAHGIFFDLDMNQIKRVTLTGFMFTFLVIFPSLLILDYVFNMNNEETINKILSEIKTLKGG